MKQIIARKNAKRLDNVSLIRSAARLIKARLDYTEALGAQMGIIGAQNTFDLATAKPDLSGIDKTGGIVLLSYTKSKSDGVNIYSKRGAMTDWALLGRATVSQFKDQRKLSAEGVPELRYYTAVYMQGDDEIGEFSDEIVINCAP